MIPVGYVYKTVVDAPEWVGAAPGTDIHSVSGCISPYFADYIPYWRHNGHWLFDRPEILDELAAQHQIGLTDQTLFYYEIWEHEYQERTREWTDLGGDLPFPVEVRVARQRMLRGYDVVTFSCGTSPECSPLSCNGLAARIGVNDHCLIESLDRARDALESGAFDDSEPGPFRIFAVYTVAGSSE